MCRPFGLTDFMQILFFMIMISMVCTWFYIYLAKIPDAPFGPANARKLLVIRGVAGFFGIWGFYFSLRYLDLAEATIINFVAPVFANIAIHIVTGRRGSPIQLIAGVICVLGVVLVLEPWNVHLRNSASEHVTAIAMALIGVLGGAGSYVAISLLEENAHPILTVAYFTTISAALNGLVMILQRQESFHLPSTSSQWLLVVSMGVLHFAMHYLSAASLTWEGCSGRALNVVYTQIVFSVLADKLVWHVNPDAWKYVGAFLVLSNAIFIAMGKPS